MLVSSFKSASAPLAQIIAANLLADPVFRLRRGGGDSGGVADAVVQSSTKQLFFSL